MLGDSQGRCETTMTERFEYAGCRCGTYPENLGPCQTFLPGIDPARCVFCDHTTHCHNAVQGKGAAETKGPPGYSRLPEGSLCRCLRLWRHQDGSMWCCNAGRPTTLLRVIIESPYAGDIEANTAYAKRAVMDSLHRGEAPIASHLLFPQPGLLKEAEPAERRLGIAAGHAWLPAAQLVAFYLDRGESPGMAQARLLAQDAGISTENRMIGPGDGPSPADGPFQRLAKVASLLAGE